MDQRYGSEIPKNEIIENADTHLNTEHLASKGKGPRDVQDLPPQLHGHILHLLAQMEHLEQQLDQLVAEAASTGSQVTTITRNLTDLDARRSLDERLTELVERLESSQERLDELTQTVTKLSRTQFRSNALAESKEQQIASALTTLQEIITRREEVQESRAAQERERRAQLRAEARCELVAELLPALDGLEMALESGRSLLARQQQQLEARAQSRAAQPQTQGVWQKLRHALASESVQTQLQPDPAITREALEALDGWLEGLDLVRERFLNLLASEGIEPVLAQDQAFDPRLHVAVEAQTRADLAPGTVLAVVRKGYRRGERVLRYAEVVVARAPREESKSDSSQ